MNLIQQTGQALAWIARVNGAFLATRLWTTVGLIFSVVVERFASILAMFLPLKVILLAGSEGVPRYFRFFIEPDQKLPWIIGLAAGTVGFYVLALVMERSARWLAELGSAEVLQGANEIAVASRQREEAQGYFARFGGVVADGVIIGTMLLVLGVLNPLLTAVVAGLVSVQYLIAVVATSNGDPVHPAGLHRILVTNLSSFLTVCGSLNFLVAFFVLLIPFLVGAGGNILVAILSILLLRQCFQAFAGGIGATVKLWSKRLQIDPLIFRDRQVTAREREVNRTVRLLFEKQARENSVTQQLMLQGIDLQHAFSEWQDSTLGRAFTFRIAAKTAGSQRYFQQQVFPKGVLHLLEHETFLFNHISRAELKAPEVVALFSEGPFECQICDYGQGVQPDGEEWVEVGPALLEHCWSVQPPRALVAAYHTSRPTLAGRLKPEFLERVTVALDYPEERRVYDTLLSEWERLIKCLRVLPLFIANPQLGRPNVVKHSADDFRIMSWGRWSLEPIGSDMPGWMPETSLPRALAQVREYRGLTSTQLSVPAVLLARDCRRLEVAIAQERYKEAISMMQRITADALPRLDAA